MIYADRILSDRKVMLGKPVKNGTRFTVELILKKLSDGISSEELLQAYPHLTKEAMR